MENNSSATANGHTYKNPRYYDEMPITRPEKYISSGDGHHSDNELVDLVKKSGDNDAMTELICRHTGIYVQTVNNYSKNDSLNSDDLIKDRAYNIFQFAMSYNPDRNMKFSTYIGSMTRYLCLSQITKSKHTVTTYNSVNLDVNSADCDANFYSPVNDYSLPYSLPSKEESIEYLKTIFSDSRLIKIIEMRHFSESGKPASWKECGEAIGVTYEWARQLYERNEQKIKSILRKDYIQ
jgi:DNA-directed RNA polymerase sigma subunit (sigma70/sigma32)